jgi:hypothetical protein
MSGNKRHLSDNRDAVRMREKRHRQAQEKEMMQNEIDALKARAQHLESIIRASIVECHCNAREQILKRMERAGVKNVNISATGASAARAPPPAAAAASKTVESDNTGDPDDEQDKFDDKASDEDAPQRTEATAKKIRMERAR